MLLSVIYTKQFYFGSGLFDNRQGRMTNGIISGLVLKNCCCVVENANN